MIAGYEILGELGRGGMGVVLKARRLTDGRDVAIKVLHRGASGITIARFERERRLQASFGEAEGFVPLLDSGEMAKGPYLVMPLLTGGTLRDRLGRGRLEMEETLTLARTLAAALGRAHARGIIHRDVKPENVIFTGEGHALLADLGLGKHFDREAPDAGASVALSIAGHTIGTPQYRAPEQALGDESVGPAADVFSLGAVLYECLTGVPAFVGDSAPEILARMSSGNYGPLREIRPETPRWLEKVVTRALRLDPEARFEDGVAFARALEPPPARGRLVVGLVALGIVTGVAATGSVALLSRKQPVTPPAVPVAHVASAAPARKTPAWYDALASTERPVFPLPRGVRFGDAPGEYVNVKDGSVLVFVAAGSFRMGREKGEDKERPRHEVRLTPYFIGKHELTVGRFEAFVRATGHVTTAEEGGGSQILNRSGLDREPSPQASWRLPTGDPSEPALPDHPVAQVSWDDAAAYCKWAGLGLATEAQWERAAIWDPVLRESRRFAWGDTLPGPGAPLANLMDRAFFAHWPTPGAVALSDDGYARTAPVGSFPAGASACGALDMIGNVSEWVQDSFDPGFYAASRGATDPCFDPAGATTRVVRGDSWLHYPGDVAATRRQVELMSFRYEAIGFRVARSGR